MDKKSVRFSHEMEDDGYRAAVHWWIQLRECGSNSPTLREFASWFAESASNRRAFAQVEALWLTVQLALSEHPSAILRSEANALRSSGERAK
jgi:ferric-dicitrate binding protein FerR (iron transport regulator)